MFCQYCGREIDDSSKFCDYCGRDQTALVDADPQGKDGVIGFQSDSRNEELGQVHPEVLDAMTRPIDDEGVAKDAGKGRSKGVMIGIVVALIAVIIVAAGAIVLIFNTNVDGEREQSTGDANNNAEVEQSGEDSTAESADSQSSLPSPFAGGSTVALNEAKKGDVVAFGSYQQDSSSGNKEDVRWVVLEVKDGHALLLSEEALDTMAADWSSSDSTESTWGNSSVRGWLNTTFLGAFDQSELDAVDTVAHGRWDTGSGNAIHDLVFLLSSDEVASYVSDSVAVAGATDYAKAQGANTFENDAANWWLRDVDVSDGSAHFANVLYDGAVNEDGYSADTSGIGIRPAVWVSLDGTGSSINAKGEVAAKSSSSTKKKSDSNNKSSKAMSAYIIPESGTKRLTKSDLAGLSDDDLARAMNEIWARHGRKFDNQWLQSYFNKQSWYKGTIAASDFLNKYKPTDIESDNAELINEVLLDHGYDVNRAHPNA